MLSDEAQLAFYGIIRLHIRMRDTRAEEIFVASRLSEDAILGMSCLTARNCYLEFARPVLLVDGREFTCTDRHGRLLISDVQVTREVLIPYRTETAHLC